MSSSHAATIPQARLALRRSLWRGTSMNWLFCGLAVAVLASVLLVLFAFHVPPLQDYGDWTYQGYLLNRLLRSAAAPVLIKPWPVPNSISEILLALLGFACGPITAARALIVAYLLASAVVMAVASRGRDGRINGAKLLLLLCIGTVHAPFWTGEINYQIGLMLFLAYVLLCRRSREPSALFTGGYAVLLFLCHALCLGMFMIYEGWRSLRRRQILRAFVSFVPVLLMAAWYKLADPRTEVAALESRPQLHGVRDVIEYFTYQAAKTGPYHNFFFGGSGDYERARLLYWAGVFANFAFAACMAALMLTWIRASWRERRGSDEFLAAVSFLALAIFDPGAYLGIANVGERLIAPALMLAVISLRHTTLAERFGAALAALSAVVLVSFAVAGLHGAEGGSVPANDVVNDPARRRQVLFWHKPFTFASQADQAEKSWAQGLPPSGPIAFETSLLMRPRGQGTAAPAR